MSKFEINPKLPLSKGVREAGRTELRAALTAIREQPRGLDVAIHDFRKSMKRLRALLRLVRREMGDHFVDMNRTLRDAGRALSSARDSAALRELVEELALESHEVPEDDALAVLSEALAERAHADHDPDRLDSALAFAREKAETADQELDALQVGSEADLWDGYLRGYKKTRRLFRVAASRGDGESFHDLRKGMKDRSYQLRLLRPLHPGSIDEELHLVDSACKVLGHEHDLFVLTELLGDLRLPEPHRNTIESLLARRREKVQRSILHRCQQLLTQKPSKKRKRLLRS